MPLIDSFDVSRTPKTFLPCKDKCCVYRRVYHFGRLLACADFFLCFTQVFVGPVHQFDHFRILMRHALAAAATRSAQARPREYVGWVGVQVSVCVRAGWVTTPSVYIPCEDLDMQKSRAMVNRIKHDRNVIPIGLKTRKHRAWKAVCSRRGSKHG